jgi:hypothetical protein
VTTAVVAFAISLLSIPLPAPFGIFCVLLAGLIACFVLRPAPAFLLALSVHPMNLISAIFFNTGQVFFLLFGPLFLVIGLAALHFLVAFLAWLFGQRGAGAAR